MRKSLAAVLLLTSLGIALGAAVHWTQRLPDGPTPIAWDREPCAHCRMRIGAPRFAAELQLEDGRVLDFDDPGCLMRQLDLERVRPRAIWFHDSESDRWLDPARVAFRRGAQTPMGFGLAAVGVGTPGALSLETARGLVRQVPVEREGGR